MSFKCAIGIHSWEDCTCTKCKKVRNDHHVLIDDCETCSKCGTVIQNQHNWSKDCEKCSKCGKPSHKEHNWTKDCETCSVCGKTRYGHHKLENGVCQSCGKGTFTDQRDGTIYKIVKIGNQVIMADNFAFLANSGSCWAYEDNEKIATKNGYLYTYQAAKELAPAGWHLPSKGEWETLYAVLGGKEKTVYEHLKVGGDSGFNALMSGWRYVRGAYNSLAASGHYWSCTDENEKEAWHFKLSALKTGVELEKGDKGLGLSVRYFRD